ncbi:MAG TPA: DinB family protein, partial [Gemmatimonadaceae bacterium]|nr:DinB family protein [Gemmatimonadaceae bacterium]
MHPRLATVIAHADRARSELLESVDAIPEPLREARPTEDAWSTAEVLEHLMRVERSVAKLMALKIGEMQAAPNGAREALDLPEFSCPQLDPMMDRSRRIDAPERVVPTGEG